MTPTEIMDLLKAADDPDHLKRPASFKKRFERRRFNALIKELGRMPAACRPEWDVIDATFVGDIDVLPDASEGAWFHVMISAFGDLASVFCTDLSRQQHLPKELLDESDRVLLQKVKDLLRSRGWTVIPLDSATAGRSAPSYSVVG